MRFYSVIKFNSKAYKPRQPLSLQLILSDDGPVQSSPPFLGAGLVQVLCLVLIPSPQVLEQSPNGVQALHPPLTINNNTRFFVDNNYLAKINIFF